MVQPARETHLQCVRVGAKPLCDRPNASQRDSGWVVEKLTRGAGNVSATHRVRMYTAMA